jgi:hypothetical protein
MILFVFVKLFEIHTRYEILFIVLFGFARLQYKADFILIFIDLVDSHLWAATRTHRFMPYLTHGLAGRV